MEGAGEGVVAFLQGTKHAGLKVTIVPESRLRLRRKSLIVDLGRKANRITQSSVKTNTDRIFKNASVPMCDVRYASTYQFSNCISSSHQSAIGSLKFPRHGTFSRSSGQFADSLRKYPIQAASSEILQRIINYTNTEQNNRRSNLRSIRSLLRKSTSYPMKYETGVNTDNDINVKKPLNRSFSTIGNRYSSQKELLNYTYDYLKCLSLIPRSTEVRYLTQIKKCIRDRLLEILDDRPGMCPKIRSRYIHHRKNFHGKPSKQTPPSKNHEVRESSRTNENNDDSSGVDLINKSCFWDQPTKCVCKTKSNKLEPLESLMTKLYPDLVVKKKDKIQSSGTLKKLDDIDHIILSVVLEWLQTIPVYANFSASDKLKQEELAYKLAKTLSKLKNQKDFILKAKSEIMSYVTASPIWHPTDLSEKEKFFEKIVTDLTKRLKHRFGQEAEQNLAKIFSNLPFKEDVDIKKIQADFVSKVTPLILHRAGDDSQFIEIIKSKVLNLLKKLPIQSNIENMHEVTNEIVDQLLQLNIERSSKDGEEIINADDYKCRENILNFFEKVPEFANIDFSENLRLIDELVSKFKKYKHRGLNDDNMKAELIEEVKNWLNDFSNTRNIRLNSKTKNSLSIKMMNHILGTDHYEIEDERKSPHLSCSRDFLDPLLTWFNTIPQLQGVNSVENRRDLSRLAKELKEIHSRGHTFESIDADMKDVIFEWLQNKFLQEGRLVESKDLDNLVNKLISELKDTHDGQRSKLSDEYGQFYEDISSWMKDVSYLWEDGHLDQNDEIIKLVNRLNNIRRSLDSTTQINDAISKFIQSLSENAGVDINEDDENMLKDKLFARWKQSSKKRKRWDKIKESYPSLSSEITSVLQEYSSSLGNTNLNDIGDKIFGAVLKNVEENRLVDYDSLHSEIKTILKQETDLVKNEQENLTNSIVQRLQRVLLQEMIQKSKVKQKKQKSPVSSSTVRSKENSKSETVYGRKTNLQAGDVRKRSKEPKILSTIYQSSYSDLEVENSMDNADITYKGLGDKTRQLAFNENKKIQTSTPISKNMKRISTAVGDDLSIENITRSTEKVSFDREGSESTQYLMKIKDIIKNWLHNSDSLRTSNLNSDEIINSLASDIIDRQKYLNLSGAKYSESDELEHLKYQIFRKFNKTKNFDKMPQIMSEIDELYSLVRKVSLPGSLKIKKFESFIAKTDENSMSNKISQWLDSISPNLLKSPNINNKLDLVKELENNLKNLEKNSNNDYQIQKEILSFLPNILRSCDDKICYELTKNFKSYLGDTLFSSTNMLKGDESSIADDNISKAIIEWLKNTPFYTISTSKERFLQRNLALLLAVNLRHILQELNFTNDNNVDLLIEEVKKYLQTIPIDSKFRNGDFYTKTATELVQYLKQYISDIKLILDGESNLSQTLRRSSSIDNYIIIENSIEQIVKNWCDSLPIHLGHDIESKELAKKIKRDIATQILETANIISHNTISPDIPLNVLLSNEIDKIFKNVPMNKELEKSLPVLKSILIDKLMKTKIENKIPDYKKILQDTFAKTLQEIENISDFECSSFVLLKEKLADAFINLYYPTNINDELRSELKEKLNNEINNFCHEYLQRCPYMSLDSKELRFNLYDTLKKVLKPEMKRSETSKESSKDSHYQLLPSSSLSSEDRAHLERIRNRAANYTEIQSIVQTKEVGTQTDFENRVEVCTQTSKTLLAETSSLNKEVLPQVVIKEFYWDSDGSRHGLEVFAPPVLSSDKRIPQSKETSNSQNQTEIKVINKNTKLHISQQFPEAVREPLSTSHEQKSLEKDQAQPSIRDSIHRQKRRDNYMIPRKCDDYRTKRLHNDTFERYWSEQPCTPENARCNRQRDRQILEDSLTIPNDRIVLRRGLCSIPNNRCKDMYCDRDSSWRMRPNTCRPSCNNKVRYCSKCCGTFCPHPTFAFFTKDF